MKAKFLRMISLAMIMIIISLTVLSCMTNRHTVGNGSQTGVVEKSRQWYALWGLVRIGDADTKTIETNTTDYKIETYSGAVDWLINIFLGWLSITSRTIKVTK